MRIPTRFEDYLAHMNARPFEGQEECPTCGEHPATHTLPAARRHRVPICHRCLHNFHGSDIAEERMVSALLGGAVRAALEAGVHTELIRAAVNDALDEAVRSEAEYYGRAAAVHERAA